jgi:uncharacterized iron-regulated membrane protein
MRARPLHKWIGVFVGIILLMWSVTGVYLMVPPPRQELRHRPLSLERATISPQQAQTIAVGDSGGEVRSVALIRIQERIAYRIETGRRPVLVDAETGERLVITAALAESIVRNTLDRIEGKVQVEAVRKHDRYYFSGSLPVWRIRFEGVDGPPSHVSQLDGAFVPARSRLRAVMHDLHNFAIIEEWVGAEWLSRWSAIVAGTVAVLSILTGYWLALPRRRPKRRTRNTEPMAVR